LLGWFLLIALAPLVFVGYLTFSTSEKALERAMESNLNALVKGKADHIGTFFRERKKDVTILAHSSYIINSFSELTRAFEKGGTSSPEYAAALREYKPFLTFYRDGYGYSDLLFIAQNGDIVFSVLHQKQPAIRNLRNEPDIHSELVKSFNVAHTLLMTEISDFGRDSPSEEPSAFVAAPILTNQRLLGILAMKFGAEQVYDLAHDYTGLGKTGEIILASRTGDRVVIVAPSRHDPDAAFKRHVLVGSPDSVPVQEAATGRKGFGSYVDYRGEKVLAAWRYLPHLRLGIVVKIDAEEAFSSARHLRNLSMAVGVMAVIGVVLVGLRVSKSIADPILTLKKGMHVVGKGDLDHKVGTNGDDEIGDLSRAFDAMTGELKRTTASVDQLSAEIDQRKQAEQRARQMMAELKRSNRDLAQFAYVASHDLREPLRKIVAFGGMLEDECGNALPENATDYLNRMRNAVNRMQNLISGLLSYSRVTTQAQPFVPVDLNDILRDVLSDLDVRLRETNGRVEADPLPAIDADPTQMRQLLQNLIENALKYHKEGVDPVVKVWSIVPDPNEEKRTGARTAQSSEDLARGPFCSLLVQDNGIGFDQKYAERIFAVFQRLHGRLEYEGTGIGLAICRNIVERHGGSITARSKPGESTTFTIRLPTKHQKEEIGDVQETC